MPRISLLDGTQKNYSGPATVQKIAEDLSPSLAKAAIAAEVDGQLHDTSFLIDHDAKLHILTAKDPKGLEVLRHSCAHLLAHAVKELFPQAQVTIGPVIEDGFYYDFAFERPFTPEDIEKIEAKMLELSKANLPVERKVLSRPEAINLFTSMGEHYKVEIIKEIPEGETLTAYQQGSFIDLCRGPHTARTGQITAFKLTKISGAYWRGDSKNEMLQRIYGTAWPDKQSLESYLKRIAEAEKRDHRKIGKKMDLFHFQEESPGNVFWHPKGWAIICAIQDYLRRFLLKHGYKEINTPQLVDKILWEESGHLSKFDNDMFVSMSENREYIVKPMNCPCHVQVFKQGIKSYRDLPLRLAEFGSCHRNEPSGTLHGLMRLRAFVQDDAHIFCTEEQIAGEVSNFIDQLHQVYRDFGFRDLIYKLSTRPKKRVGSDEVWDKAEKALADALNLKGVKWEELKGEGAFYGPKIEFSLRDSLGRVWQLGTMQVDYAMADRLDAHYIAEDGSKRPPVMLHRAMLGSIERFVGILLEEYAGNLPLWLAPVQVVVMNITDQQADYAQKVAENFQNLGLRVLSDLRNEKIGFKIREHTIAHIPYQVIIGNKEMAERTVSVRALSTGESETMTIAQLVGKLQTEIVQKRSGLQRIPAQSEQLKEI